MLEKVDPMSVLKKAITQPARSIAKNSETPASRSDYYCPCREYCDYRRPLEWPLNVRGMSFDTYVPETRNRGALEAARRFGSDSKSLYLFGLPGTGKTHLLMSAYKEALKTHCPCYVACFNVARLLKIERRGFETREEAEERFLEGLSRKKLIFLDDFCAENITGRTAEFVYLLLNDAVENGRPCFFFTSNQSTIYINDNISARIASRVNGLCGKENILKVEGEDWRLRGGSREIQRI